MNECFNFQEMDDLPVNSWPGDPGKEAGRRRELSTERLEMNSRKLNCHLIEEDELIGFEMIGGDTKRSAAVRFEWQLMELMKRPIDGPRDDAEMTPKRTPVETAGGAARAVLGTGGWAVGGVGSIGAVCLIP
jgi:hypothetical protein